MESPLIIADPADGSYAAPAPSVAGPAALEISQSLGSLRAALADAIAIRRAKSALAMEAAGIAARADIASTSRPWFPTQPACGQ
jgi:hypothetical protein